jgi:hypothetical protein
MKRVLVAGLLMMFMAGCGENTQKSSGANQQPSGGSSTLDAMTQRNALEAGQRAGQQLRKISAERNKDMKDAQGE